MQKLLFIYILATLVACNNKSLLTTLEEEQTELATQLIATTDKNMERFIMKNGSYYRSVFQEDYGYGKLLYLADTIQSLKTTFFTRLDSYSYTTSNYGEVINYVDSMANGLFDFVDSSRIGAMVRYIHDLNTQDEYSEWEHYKEGVQRIKNNYDSSLARQKLRIAPTTQEAWHAKITTHKMLYVFALRELQELLASRGRCLCDDWDFVWGADNWYKDKYQVGEVYNNHWYIRLAYSGKRTDSIQLFLNDTLVKKDIYRQEYSIGEYIDTRILGKHPLKVEVLMRDIRKGWIHYGQKMYEYEVVE